MREHRRSPHLQRCVFRLAEIDYAARGPQVLAAASRGVSAGCNHVSVVNHDHFAGEVLVEPGRYLVGDAGVIQAEVVLISRRPAGDQTRWVYLDIGLFNGLTEALDEAIRYRIRTPPGRGAPGPVVLAGPSCDSTDVLYEKSGYQLPAGLRIGDKLQPMSAGAYTGPTRPCGSTASSRCARSTSPPPLRDQDAINAPTPHAPTPLVPKI